MQSTLVAASAAAALLVGSPVAAPANDKKPTAETIALQIALQGRGFYDGRLDGIGGAKTAAALAAFQRRAKLPPTGRLDRRSRLALGPLGVPLPGKRAVRGRMAGWDVSVLEFELARHGFSPGKLDGRFDRWTQRALRGFQKYARLAVDGVAGRATFAALRQTPVARCPLRLAWPLPQRVTQRFGLSGRWFHTGIEIAAPYGAAIAAPAHGRVTWAGFMPNGRGYVVTIDHGDGVRTMFSHLARYDVRVGQRVVRGALIGLVGWTGNAKKAHLQFEVRVRGAAVDPLTVLR